MTQNLGCGGTTGLARMGAREKQGGTVPKPLPLPLHQLPFWAPTLTAQAVCPSNPGRPLGHQERGHLHPRIASLQPELGGSGASLPPSLKGSPTVGMSPLVLKDPFRDQRKNKKEVASPIREGGEAEKRAVGVS